jgi:hypothetical protein
LRGRRERGREREREREGEGERGRGREREREREGEGEGEGERGRGREREREREERGVRNRKKKKVNRRASKVTGQKLGGRRAGFRLVLLITICYCHRDSPPLGFGAYCSKVPRLLSVRGCATANQVPGTSTSLHIIAIIAITAITAPGD